MVTGIKKIRTFGGKKYRKGVGGNPSRRFTKQEIQKYAKTARDAGHNVRVIKISDKRGYAVYMN